MFHFPLPTHSAYALFKSLRIKLSSQLNLIIEPSKSVPSSLLTFLKISKFNPSLILVFWHSIFKSWY